MTQAATRVLVVDDHQVVLWGLCKLLESARPDIDLVAGVSTTEQALFAFNKHRPDVVLLDLNLGDESGLELLPVMREEASVIVITGSHNVSSEQLVLHGARGIIRKSEPAEVILKAIARVHAGETWADRRTISRVLNSVAARKNSPWDELTPAERKVVTAVLEHKSAPNKVVAASLHISEHTLRNHLSKIYSKLDIRRRIDLVLYARDMSGASFVTATH